MSVEPSSNIRLSSPADLRWLREVHRSGDRYDEWKFRRVFVEGWSKILNKRREEFFPIFMKNAERIIAIEAMVLVAYWHTDL